MSELGERVRDQDVEETLEDEAPEPARYRGLLNNKQIDSDAIKVIRRLVRSGYSAYLVGGSVRDLLAGQEPKDFDVATNARPEQVRKLFRNCRIIGRRFRLAHVLFSRGKIIEVATYRRDPGQRFEILEADALDSAEPGNPVRLAPMVSESAQEDDDLLIRSDNVFGLPHEDAVRRDFTINGLFYDVDNEAVIDYVGGVPDVKQHLICTIGDPVVRFREDPVRILRAIKFASRLGLKIEEETYDAMISERDELTKSAKPRLLEELLRLLRSGQAHEAYDLAWQTGVLSVLLPELAAYLDDHHGQNDRTWKRLDALDERARDGKSLSDTLLLATLLHDPLMEVMHEADDPNAEVIDFMRAVGERLTVPRRVKDQMRLLFMAQKRMINGKLGALPRRDFYEDARELFVIDQQVRGRDLPKWVSAPRPQQSPRGRKKRRRRRRSTGAGRLKN